MENNPARAYYRLIEVYETTLQNVAKQHYKAEGFISQKSCFEQLKEIIERKKT